MSEMEMERENAWRICRTVNNERSRLPSYKMLEFQQNQSPKASSTIGASV